MSSSYCLVYFFSFTFFLSCWHVPPSPIIELSFALHSYPQIRLGRFLFLVFVSLPSSPEGSSPASFLGSSVLGRSIIRHFLFASLSTIPSKPLTVCLINKNTWKHHFPIVIMDIPSAFTTSPASLPIRTRTPDIPGPSEPSTPGASGLDSGYASLLTTPEKPSTESDHFDFGSSYTLDSTAGDPFEKLFRDDPSECPRSAFLTPHQKLLKLASSSLKASANNTRPQSIRVNSTRANSLRQPHRACGSLPSTFYSKTLPRSTPRQRSESLSQILAPGTLPSSIRAPDRFVHPRDSECAAFPIGEKFRMTKATNELSSSEKILRRGKISVDAFSVQERRPNLAPTYANERQFSFAMSGRPTQTRARTTLGTGTVDDDPETEFQQRVNRGSVWSISTIPPAMGAVNNGHGILTQSGTSSAPFFTSPFSHVPRYNAHYLDKHPGRLAAALEFDRTARLLQCNVDKGVFHLQSDNVPRSPAKKQKLLPKTEKTKWSGTGWVNESLKKSWYPPKTFELRPGFSEFR